MSARSTRRGTKVPRRPRLSAGRRRWWTGALGGLVAAALTGQLTGAGAAQAGAPVTPDVGHHGALPGSTVPSSDPAGTTDSGAAARRGGVRLDDPVLTSDDAVRLDGRAGARRVVLLEVRRSGHWRLTARTRAGADGTFSFDRALQGRSFVVRATSQRDVSRSHRVPAKGEGGPIDPADPADPTDPTDPTAPSAPSDACGVQPKKADGSYWSCSLVDDFDGTTLDRTTWLAHDGAVQNGICLEDDPSTVSVSGGQLHLTAHTVAQPRTCQGTTSNVISGQVSTYHLFSQQYGRFEARMRNTAYDGKGLHEAFWLWPDDRQTQTTTWPAAGEIDIAETYSAYDDLAIPFLHYTANDNGGPIPGTNTAWDCRAPRGQWHTYTLSWTAQRIQIDVDGTTCLVNTSGDSAFDKAYIIALTQALGVTGNEPDANTPLPATTDVDYVKVWR